jgi:hypothetical protein
MKLLAACMSVAMLTQTALAAGKTFTHQDSKNGFSLEFPDKFEPTSIREDGVVFQLIEKDYAGGEVGDSSPLSIAVKIFDAGKYARPTIADYHWPDKSVKITRRKIKLSGITATKVSYSNGAPEAARDYFIDFEVPSRGRLYILSFMYTVSERWEKKRKSDFIVARKKEAEDVVSGFHIAD